MKILLSQQRNVKSEMVEICNRGSEVEAGEEMLADACCLGTLANHLSLKEADKRHKKNIERMKKAKRKKVIAFNCNDFVSVKIPRIDRASTDSHHLPCLVVQMLGTNITCTD